MPSDALSRTRRRWLLFVGLATTLSAGTAGLEAAERFDLGRPPTPAELQAWDIDARGDGAGLPPGQGGVAQGARLYASKCAACHGTTGRGGAGPALVGGRGTLASQNPVRTVGSYWPYAPTLYDYIHRAMPYDAPQSLAPDKVYALTAYILHQNGIVPAGAVMDASTLAKVRMPNRDGFIPDPRPDVP